MLNVKSSESPVTVTREAHYGNIAFKPLGLWSSRIMTQTSSRINRCCIWHLNSVTIIISLMHCKLYDYSPIITNFESVPVSTNNWTFFWIKQNTFLMDSCKTFCNIKWTSFSYEINEAKKQISHVWLQLKVLHMFVSYTIYFILVNSTFEW